MNNRTMLPALKNNAVAGYQGPVKKDILKGAGLLLNVAFKLCQTILNSGVHYYCTFHKGQLVDWCHSGPVSTNKNYHS